MQPMNKKIIMDTLLKDFGFHLAEFLRRLPSEQWYLRGLILFFIW